MLGTSGLVYTAVMMGIRFFDGSYAAGGKFHALMPAGGAPVFGVKGTNPVCFLVRVKGEGFRFQGVWAPILL